MTDSSAEAPATDFDWDRPPTVIARRSDPAAQVPAATLKARPEWFVVEEVPAYPASGDGDFHFVQVQKTNVSAGHFVRVLAQRLGVAARDLGVAGTKDKRAQTTQWVSVPRRPGPSADALPKLEGPVGDDGQLKLVQVRRHHHKLKTGHLKANRFRIGLADVDPACDPGIGARLTHYAHVGFPNAYGPQRFSNGKTVQAGRRLLQGKAIKDRRLRRLAISAVQAALFNHWLARRATDQLLEHALEGDVLARRESGGIFVCEDAPTDTDRIARGSVVVTGPMPGSRYRAAVGASGDRDTVLWRDAGLTPDVFKGFGKMARGTRRHALAWPTQTGWERDGDLLWLSFTLPPGVYATTLLALVVGPELTTASSAPAGPNPAADGA